MEALLTARRGDPVSAQQLDDALASARVVHGIDTNARAKLVERLERPDFEAKALSIARGVAPVSGRASAFEPAFEWGPVPGRARADGSIDFHERDWVRCVSTDDRLGLLVLASPGIPGRSVDGREIPALAGRPSVMTFGSGVELLPGGEVRSRRTGAVLYRAGVSLDVTDHYIHPGHVDLASGDLHIRGSIGIRGDIAPTFCVEATGDVGVDGSVDGAVVRAGGHVRVRQCIRGGSHAIVWADGDVVAQRAESATLRCAGILRLTESLSSHLSGRRVEVTRLLRGGEAIAEEAIVVREAGAMDGTATLLVAGQPVARSLDEVLGAIAVAKASRALGGRSRGGASSARLGDRNKGGKVGRGQGALASAAQRERLAQAERRRELAAVAFVKITGDALSGVVVRIGSASFNVNEPMRNVRFSLDEATHKIEWEGGAR
jgi:uncharacterized protein (DUF342 family)